MVIEKAIFACGCFWGVQYLFSKFKGVKHSVVGYIGGHKENPKYPEVKAHTTGHAEAILVEYDSEEVTYEELCKFFFEIHDPAQTDGQGPDIGPQYRSEIFYIGESQKETALKVIELLKSKGFEVNTKVTEATKFWDAEDYHQNYYDKNGEEPYCHRRVKKF
ncbi:methionine-S-sulfoxide reductase family protein [Trichomonas vaginalis G3]|uniref:peptide-methionine (S)-S-oxide reductase n=1 Tax=Trichomonas vaginalis (strain ATCC PRA-98 / G3) TaxID=412133 RepID=A2G497_TRIV3|nr:peptide-methionine (S)-S-oxide reductase protein [Trichomonas vaginalis G3]EAX88025.1 methionine-S-sulfoxide reductase family protein [Trichomonas vaginalis G3]KAI5551544.1 peptide-methionine (S)-S-oxide reductase protein [Trichomonas vaginalis G3]|eukprot:XP_001300955.1 methionine-S-sulfoxide reductase family protein [Trichomonas vaginalis G3]